MNCPTATEAKDRYRSFDPDAANPVIGRRGAIAGAAGQVVYKPNSVHVADG